MNYTELEQFFTDLVGKAQARGITCGITSGMACVHYGLTSNTKDCDVLCTANQAAELFEVIAETVVRDQHATYRGNLSPPLDDRWLRGGWTAHFEWVLGAADELPLDVFAVAPRGSTRWEDRLIGRYVDPHVVAEMKRTNRDKDWPFVTGLGGQMIEAGESRGWLHLYDLEVLRRFAGEVAIPADLLAIRPVLRLAPFEDTLRMKRLLHAERAFWAELDELRIRLHQQFLRPYTSAVRRAGGRDRDLQTSHDIRVQCALEHLPPCPLRDYGVDRVVREAAEIVAVTVGADVVEWLPKAIENFHGITP